MQRNRVANYHDYMDSHKDEIFELIERGVKQKRIARLLQISAMTLSNYLYFWANGVNRQKNQYINKFRLADEAPILQRVSSGTRGLIDYNTAVNDKLIERPVYQRNFYGNPLVIKILDKEIIK